MRRALLHCLAPLLLTSLVTGCLPFGLGGNVDGRDLDFVSAAYFELRGIDSATSIEFHRVDLWLMPMEDPCTTFPDLLNELADLRRQIDEDGLAPDAYCDQWEAAFEASTGLEGFWLAQVRLDSLPREDNESVETDYIFVDDASEAIPTGPHFDATLAWYPPTTFDACAVEFSADTVYAPDVFGASGGTAAVNKYSEDEEVTVTVRPSFPSDDGEIAGQTTAEFCSAAADSGLAHLVDPEMPSWPVEFGLGL